MIQTLTLKEIFRVFVQTYPLDKIAFTKFRMLKPWNFIKAYRETCLCRSCEAFRLFVKALNVVGDLLLKHLQPDDAEAQRREDAVEDNADDSPDGEENEAMDAARAQLKYEVKQLADFCKLDSKSDMVQQLVCAPCLMSAEPACVDGSCPRCGFKKLWSKGLRLKLVDKEGNLLPAAAAVWEQDVRYEILKSGSKKAPSDGSATEEKDTLRDHRTGTLVEFLDAFEEASAKFPAHRHLVVDAKEKVRRLPQQPSVVRISYALIAMLSIFPPC